MFRIGYAFSAVLYDAVYTHRYFYTLTRRIKAIKLIREILLKAKQYLIKYFNQVHVSLMCIKN